MPLGPSSLHLAIAAACFAALSTTQSAAAAQLDPTTAHALLLNPHFDVAENADFWGNVVRYGRFFVTVMLGTGTIMLRPLAAAFKNPLSAIAAIGGVAGLFFLVQLTLKLMLGIETPEDATLYGF